MGGDVEKMRARDPEGDADQPCIAEHDVTAHEPGDLVERVRSFDRIRPRLDLRKAGDKRFGRCRLSGAHLVERAFDQVLDPEFVVWGIAGRRHVGYALPELSRVEPAGDDIEGKRI